MLKKINIALIALCFSYGAIFSINTHKSCNPSARSQLFEGVCWSAFAAFQDLNGEKDDKFYKCVNGFWHEYDRSDTSMCKNGEVQEY